MRRDHSPLLKVKNYLSPSSTLDDQRLAAMMDEVLDCIELTVPEVGAVVTERCT